jgi:hypothetical protein
MTRRHIQQRSRTSMNRITVDPVIVEKLGAVPGQTIVCDEQGRALGFFSPLTRATPLEELNLESPLSLEETQALRKDRTGKPLAEILDRLGLS